MVKRDKRFTATAFIWFEVSVKAGTVCVCVSVRLKIGKCIELNHSLARSVSYFESGENCQSNAAYDLFRKQQQQ